MRRGRTSWAQTQISNGGLYVRCSSPPLSPPAPGEVKAFKERPLAEQFGVMLHYTDHCVELPPNARAAWGNIIPQVDKRSMGIAVAAVRRFAEENGDPAFCTKFKPIFEHWGTSISPAAACAAHRRQHRRAAGGAGKD